MTSHNTDFSKVLSKYIVMPIHTNPNGLMFGGVLMGWIDMAAAMVAEKHAGTDAATVHISDMHFRAPVYVGDHVCVEAVLISTGKTSMQIRVTVSSENVKLKQVQKVTEATLTFVAVDKMMNPCNVPKLDQ